MNFRAIGRIGLFKLARPAIVLADIIQQSFESIYSGREGGMAELRKLVSRCYHLATRSFVTGQLVLDQQFGGPSACVGGLVPTRDVHAASRPAPFSRLKVFLLALFVTASFTHHAAARVIHQDIPPSQSSMGANAIRIPQSNQHDLSHEQGQSALRPETQVGHGLGWRTLPIPSSNAPDPVLASERFGSDDARREGSPPPASHQALWQEPAPYMSAPTDPTHWSLYQSNFEGLSTLNSNSSTLDRNATGPGRFWEQPATMLQTQGGDSAFDYPLDEPTISSESAPGEFFVEEECIEPMEFEFNNLTRSEMLRLMAPSIKLAAEYIPEVGGYALTNYAATTQIPTYPFFGPPPPFISAGFAYHDLTIPMGVDLPSVLYEIGLGASWIRKMPNGWFLRASVDGVFASDFENQSSDAWQLRGGLFTLITLNPQWQLTAGTLVTGRQDIPVIPAAGLIWTPSYDRRVELMLPRPRIAQLIVDGQTRQQWAYVGAGFGGGTFAYEQAAHVDDQLTYREWRAFLGWEFIPRREPGQFRVTGLQLAAELGYVFGRSYEFESARPDIDLDDAAVFRLIFQH